MNPGVAGWRDVFILTTETQLNNRGPSIREKPPLKRQGFLHRSACRYDLPRFSFLLQGAGTTRWQPRNRVQGRSRDRRPGVLAGLSPADPPDPAPPPTPHPAPRRERGPSQASGGLAWRIFVCDTIVIWAPFGRSKLSCLHSARLK